MSLYWTLAVIVTLVHCITGIPIKYEHIVITIDQLMSESCIEPSSRFYTPSTDTGCIYKALDCSILELNIIRSECFDVNSTGAQYVNRTRDMITQKLHATNNTLPGEFKSCFCGYEAEQKPYEDFLRNLKTLIQMLSSS